MTRERETTLIAAAADATVAAVAVHMHNFPFLVSDKSK